LAFQVVVLLSKARYARDLQESRTMTNQG
jgi:hypothetical protein